MRVCELLESVKELVTDANFDCSEWTTHMSRYYHFYYVLKDLIHIVVTESEESVNIELDQGCFTSILSQISLNFTKGIPLSEQVIFYLSENMPLLEEYKWILVIFDITLLQKLMMNKM
ncbi:1134_t:CDS:2, partial [Diversispora eburnea]